MKCHKHTKEERQDDDKVKEFQGPPDSTFHIVMKF